MASSSKLIESELQQNSAPTPTTNVDSSNATDENPPSKKQKKLKSDVWNHFDRTQTIEVVNGKRITNVTATCKVCSKTFEANSKHGTTRLQNHYTGKHGVPIGQGLISSVGEAFKYDEESSRKKLALAVVMHEYPFRIVEHKYFVDFVKSLRPSFQMKSRTTCRKEILEMFKEERGKVYKFLGSLSCRLSSTMDLWTSRHNKSYMCVTVHFIDDKWNMQKNIISFMSLRGRHTGANLCQAVMKILFDWNIDKKMFSLTLDNDGANGVCVREMVERLNKIGGICCGGKLFHVRCAAHIMNLVMQDGINVIRKGIDNIREVVGKVKHSPILREEFEKRASDCKLDIGRALSLDVSTRWNSTYMMLRDAIYYREAFERMYILNHAWFSNFPSSQEWQEANELCKILKNFHTVTEVLSGTSYPTSNLFFAKFCDIKLRIGDWLRKKNLTIVKMTSLMKGKFDKYWDQSNIVLAIGSFLDPRYKMGLIEFYYPKIYQNKGAVELEEFNRVLKELYGEYVLKYQSVEEVAQDGGGSVPGGDTSDGDEDRDNELNEFMLERSQPWNRKSDLDRYLERRPTSCPQGQDFNVLNWWKSEGKDYQILSKLAQDVLAVPVSTVASESAFSTGGRVINAYRSKLDSEVVEALVCIQDWIRGDKKDCVASIFDSMEEIEEDGDDNSD